MVKFALLRYLSEFRLRVSSFWLEESRSRFTQACRAPLKNGLFIFHVHFCCLKHKLAFILRVPGASPRTLFTYISVFRSFKGALQLLSNCSKYIRFAQVPERNSVSSSDSNLSAIYPYIRNNSEEASDWWSKLKRLLCYESQHQSQSNEKSLVQFDYEKAVLNYLGTQSTFKKVRPLTHPEDGNLPAINERSAFKPLAVLGSPWGRFFLINSTAVGLARMKRSSFGIRVHVNPWVNLGERFIRVNPTDV